MKPAWRGNEVGIPCERPLIRVRQTDPSGCGRLRPEHCPVHGEEVRRRWVTERRSEVLRDRRIVLRALIAAVCLGAVLALIVIHSLLQAAGAAGGTP